MFARHTVFIHVDCYGVPSKFKHIWMISTFGNKSGVKAGYVSVK